MHADIIVGKGHEHRHPQDFLNLGNGYETAFLSAVEQNLYAAVQVHGTEESELFARQVQTGDLGGADQEYLPGFVEDLDRKFFQNAGKIGADHPVVAPGKLQQVANLHRVDTKSGSRPAGRNDIEIAP